MSTETKMVLGEPGTYRIVSEALPTTEVQDLSLTNVTMHGLKDYVRVRKQTILAFNVAEYDMGAHLQVNERLRTITLVMLEHGGFQAEGETYNPKTTITATANFSEDHKTVTGLMNSKYSADNLSKVIRKNRHLFTDEASWKALWTDLRNTQLEIGRITEATSNDLGSRKKGFDEKIINAKAIQFQMEYAVFEGEPKVALSFEVMYEIVNGDVQLSLLCDAMTLTEREKVKEMMDDTVNYIVQTLEDKVPVIRMN